MRLGGMFAACNVFFDRNKKRRELMCRNGGKKQFVEMRIWSWLLEKESDDGEVGGV